MLLQLSDVSGFSDKSKLALAELGISKDIAVNASLELVEKIIRVLSTNYEPPVLSIDTDSDIIFIHHPYDI